MKTVKRPSLGKGAQALAGTSSALVILAVIACATPAASAQNIHPPTLTQDEFDAHVHALNLSEEQKTEAQAAFGFYVAERAGADRAWKVWLHWSGGMRISQYGGSDDEFDRDAGKAYDRAEERWQAAIRQLEEDYFQRLASINSRLQERVATLKRARLRSWLLKPQVIQSAPFGATLDLIAAIKRAGIQVDPDSPLAAALREYEVELDEQLREWDRTWPLWCRDLGAAGGRLQQARVRGEEATEADTDAFVEVWMQRHVRVFNLRSLQVRTVQSVLALLPNEQSAAFRGVAYRELFPFVYGHDRPLLLIRAARGLNDLTDDQRGALQSFEMQFNSASETERLRLNPLYESMESTDSYRKKYRAQASWYARRSDDDSLPGKAEFDQGIEAWERRVSQFESQVRDVLTAAQRERLP